ncbi:ligand-binding SRPBCC domain-containing protein [Silvibacterium bohemicum]|uniref:Ligand-binding SRPBCC domain-containing protein n=1 Tax=Silvibacterium bohemicum TaxID=1577686 RepID=A0A841JTT3_9BACT|nr:SRPBCC family protein [Silvibacterium bohemicum]MBB6144812.1 ligand-binding SRPBCC domain-containing protein [Silvibacterium bohemicum]
MVHRFTASQWLPYPVPFVFAFLADPQNLPGLMPRWQNARVEEVHIVAPPAPANEFRAGKLRGASAGAGSTITLSFRPFPLSPIRLSWEAVISEFAWNDRFCDVQQRGPFAAWRHCHSVKAERRAPGDGTAITDDVSYEMKFGALGERAHSLFMEGQIKKTFAYRQRRMAEIFDRIAPAAMKLAR